MQEGSRKALLVGNFELKSKGWERISHAERKGTYVPGQGFWICRDPDLGISQVYSRNRGNVGKGQIMQYAGAIIKNLALVNLSVWIRKSLDGSPWENDQFLF